MATERVRMFYRLGQLWCSCCLRDLRPDEVLLSDDDQDGRLFCKACAPNERCGGMIMIGENSFRCVRTAYHGGNCHFVEGK